VRREKRSFRVEPKLSFITDIVDEDGQVVAFFTQEVSTSTATTARPVKTIKLQAFHQEIPFNPGFPGFRTRTCVIQINEKLFEELAKIACTVDIPSNQVPLLCKKKKKAS
jgi:hypothetical protein